MNLTSSQGFLQSKFPGGNPASSVLTIDHNITPYMVIYYYEVYCVNRFIVTLASR